MKLCLFINFCFVLLIKLNSVDICTYFECCIRQADSSTMRHQRSLPVSRSRMHRWTRNLHKITVNCKSRDLRSYKRAAIHSKANVAELTECCLTDPCYAAFTFILSTYKLKLVLHEKSNASVSFKTYILMRILPVGLYFNRMSVARASACG